MIPPGFTTRSFIGLILLAGAFFSMFYHLPLDRLLGGPLGTLVLGAVSIGMFIAGVLLLRNGGTHVRLTYGRQPGDGTLPPRK